MSFLKDRTENNQKNFKHQRNFCKKLLRTTKKSYYSTLDIKKLQITKPSGKQSYLFSQKGFWNAKKSTLLKMAKIFLMILNYVISSMAFSLILFPNLTSLKSINVFWMIWIQIQFSLFSTHLKITQALRISKVKSLIRHFLLRTLTLM